MKLCEIVVFMSTQKGFIFLEIKSAVWLQNTYLDLAA